MTAETENRKQQRKPMKSRVGSAKKKNSQHSGKPSAKCLWQGKEDEGFLFCGIKTNFLKNLISTPKYQRPRKCKVVSLLHM